MKEVNNLAGKIISGWTLGNELGHGADGIVYCASKAGATAAVKVFFPESLKRNGFDAGQQRLERQLTLKGKKHNSHLVEIYDGGFDDELETLFLVMELVSGNSLDKVIDRVPRDCIAPLIYQLADAAKFLESMELVHRDIKPANIVVSDDFSTLTLLDLGVILTAPHEDDPRLSGDSFVATVRYSPPEFVWRKEEGSIEAWRAITFYQIGATLHDLIMQRPLFAGLDNPRACLYEAVKSHTPTINANGCHENLVQLAKCCLIKDWRERSQLVSWESFQKLTNPDASDGAEEDYSSLQRRIRLWQIRGDEIRQAKLVTKSDENKTTRAKALWDLHDKLFMELRQFLMASTIFPKCISNSDSRNLRMSFDFVPDEELMFVKKLNAELQLSADDQFAAATKMGLVISLDGKEEIYRSEWTEMFTVESSAALVKHALLQSAEAIVPKS